jgi:phosphatidylserine/phosphatidylglycerophosphate/cardiolipin synthase-like enzyme
VLTNENANDGLTFKAHRGEGAALLAFDIDPDLREGLAGFAVRYRTPEDKEWPITNRLTFEAPITAETTPAERVAITTPTDKAPLQKFHWVHFPRRVPPGTFAYTATAMLFKAGSETETEPGPSTTVELDLKEDSHPDFALGFTRGYLSSQAYAELFDNAPIQPTPATFDFDTADFVDQYRWLGFRGREMVFGILDAAIADADARLDVFAYDLDEPDVIRKLAALGGRLRIFLDDSDSHDVPKPGKEAPPEVGARAALERSAGAGNVKAGHFGALAHDKVFILRRGDGRCTVLAGSANFSVRGLYAQANNVFVFDDAGDGSNVADLYQAVFDAAWTAPAKFHDSKLAAQWHPLRGDGLPASAVSFAPHRDPGVSLDRVAAAIDHAESSVLFAIMNVGTGTGPVLDRIQAIGDREDLYAYGTTQRLEGDIKTTTPTDPDSPFIPFGFLRDKVPEPFRAEISGGTGYSIHHKFVVCDFNGDNPVAYGGSSNLAAGGESKNGDNLVEFRDPAVATGFAVEAVRLIDHYRFRAVQHAATTQAPLRLKGRSEDWTRDYFDPDSAKHLERKLFVR